MYAHLFVKESILFLAQERERGREREREREGEREREREGEREIKRASEKRTQFLPIQYLIRFFTFLAVSSTI